MAAVFSTPILAYIATVQALTGVNQSSSLYFSVQVTGGWEYCFPAQIRYSNVSADAVVNAYATMDGGANYDSVPCASWNITRQGSVTRQVSCRLPTGQYLIQILNSGPNSASVGILTATQVSAVQNV